jgi:2-oxoglutarate dehydrogenase E2 component (dihydrolipoamide succinyltransferase)
MPTNVIMPQMGESVAEGTITKWLKKVGERVERDEPLFEISTDKVDAEIPSPAAGLLAKILVKENETVGVNTVVAVIDGEGAGVAAGAVAEEQLTPPPPPPAASISLPSTMLREAEPFDVAQGREPVERQGRSLTAPSPAERERGAAPPPAAAPPNAGLPSEAAEVRSSPLVRRIAREHQVDLTQVKGTGLAGRVSKKDILSYLEEQRRLGGAPPAAAVRPPSAPPRAPGAPPQVVFTGPTQVVPMTPMRRQIAEHMVTSKRTSAHVYTVFEVELTKVVEMRERHKEEFERQHGLKLTYTPFFVRAAVEAIKEIPIINSSVEGTNIVFKRDMNIGIAVALEHGLIVPVIKRADEKNFLGIARAVQDLAERARLKHLSVDDVQEGTFTITNPGSFGGLFGLPIINQPQVAILGVGAIEKRPVVRDDAIAIRPMVYLSLSYDHRVVDGAVAEQFLGKIKRILENWNEAVL